ncbi:MAG: 2-oxo acid dehydrogenase subunit E2 [Anaerolineae bacterium]|nr:2-oxo acid dehydrogenase subunit E2 [Anaerolineae bacterium]
MPTNILMPQLGESVVEGTVTKWLKQEGEPVAELEALLEVNTDKVDTEIPSPTSGVLLKILVAEGTTVKAGTLLAVVGQPGESVPLPETPATAVETAGPEKAPVSATAPTVEGRDHELGFISPVVAKLAAENKVDLSQVKGSGSGGRITKKDVLIYLESDKGQAAPQAAWETPGEGDLFRPTELQFGQQTTPTQAIASTPSAAQPAPGALLPLTPVRREIARRMVASVQSAPHVTTVMEADLHQVAAHRAANKAALAQQGVNLTFTPYFIAAIVAGLKAFPMVNSSFTEQGIQLHADINIGVAVSLGEEGLIVPVIRNADGLSLIGLAKSVNNLAQRARSRHLQPDEVQGGTFTLTNHGTGGSLFATPIINQPQCAILGVGTIQKRAVVIDDAIAIRPMAYLSLTFDHRILDGAGADGFLASVVQTLEGWT